VITKHPGTGGLVSTDTVTAQLVYEIQSSRYLGPDVTVLLDSLDLTPDGDDRVRISGARGEAPPPTLKVCVNQLGGFRNQMEVVLTGLDIEDKAAWVRTQVEAALRVRPAELDWSLARTDHPDASSEEAASARLRCVVRDPSSDVVGRGFTGPLIELALASYPGFAATTPPTPATPYGVYRAAHVPQESVTHTVHLPSGEAVVIEPPVVMSGGVEAHVVRRSTSAGSVRGWSSGGSTRVPLGTFVHARSGDKGGDANLGLWVSAADPLVEQRAAWLLSVVTPEWVRGLLPEAAELEVDVAPLPNLHAVNVVLHDLLGLGVAASSRFDPQAKGLGEWARSRYVDVPEELV